MHKIRRQIIHHDVEPSENTQLHMQAHGERHNSKHCGTCHRSKLMNQTTWHSTTNHQRWNSNIASLGFMKVWCLFITKSTNSHFQYRFRYYISNQSDTADTGYQSETFSELCEILQYLKFVGVKILKIVYFVNFQSPIL